MKPLSNNSSSKNAVYVDHFNYIEFVRLHKEKIVLKAPVARMLDSMFDQPKAYQALVILFSYYEFFKNYMIYRIPEHVRDRYKSPNVCLNAFHKMKRDKGLQVAVERFELELPEQLRNCSIKEAIETTTKLSGSNSIIISFDRNEFNSKILSAVMRGYSKRIAYSNTKAILKLLEQSGFIKILYDNMGFCRISMGSFKKFYTLGRLTRKQSHKIFVARLEKADLIEKFLLQPRAVITYLYHVKPFVINAKTNQNLSIPVGLNRMTEKIRNEYNFNPSSILTVTKNIDAEKLHKYVRLSQSEYYYRAFVLGELNSCKLTHLKANIPSVNLNKDYYFRYEGARFFSIVDFDTVILYRRKYARNKRKIRTKEYRYQYYEGILQSKNMFIINFKKDYTYYVSGLVFDYTTIQSMKQEMKQNGFKGIYDSTKVYYIRTESNSKKEIIHYLRSIIDLENLKQRLYKIIESNKNLYLLNKFDVDIDLRRIGRMLSYTSKDTSIEKYLEKFQQKVTSIFEDLLIYFEEKSIEFDEFKKIDFFSIIVNPFRQLYQIFTRNIFSESNDEKSDQITQIRKETTMVNGYVEI